MLNARRNRKTSIENRVTRIEMFTISVEAHFWASHQLTLSDGSKEPMHCHNWSVIADVSSKRLNRMGLVTDFDRLKTQLYNIVAEFDNMALNKTEYFQQNNSSAENVAKYIYEKLRTKLPKGVKLQSIKVVEEPGFTAKFTGNEPRK